MSIFFTLCYPNVTLLNTMGPNAKSNLPTYILIAYILHLLTLWYFVTKKGSGHKNLDNEHKIKMYNHLSQNIFILFDNIHFPNLTTPNYKYQLSIIWNKTLYSYIYMICPKWKMPQMYIHTSQTLQHKMD
jgi:hypothetical protein